MSILAAGEVSVKEAANILEHANQLRRKRSRSRYVHVPKGKRYRRQYGIGLGRDRKRLFAD